MQSRVRPTKVASRAAVCQNEEKKTYNDAAGRPGISYLFAEMLVTMTLSAVACKRFFGIARLVL